MSVYTRHSGSFPARSNNHFHCLAFFTARPHQSMSCGMCPLPRAALWPEPSPQPHAGRLPLRQLHHGLHSIAAPSDWPLLTTAPRRSSPAPGISPERGESCATQQHSGRALAAESKVSPRCGKASSCCHMWECSLQPPLQLGWLFPSGGNCCLQGDRKCYPSYMKFLAFPVGWAGPHDTNL